MPLIPYQRFSISTATTPTDATARLAAAVARSPLLRWAVTDLPFEGWVRGDEFKISRVIKSGRKGAFAPLIRGRIIATPGGSRLEGRMRLHHSALVFLAPWSALMALIASLAVREARLAWGFGVLAMLVGGWAVGLRGFASEARQARQLLHRVLEGGDQALLLDESRRPTRWAAIPHAVHDTPR